MLSELPELVLAPMLVGCATLVDRRWGARVGGVVSALPAVVAPVLLIAAQTRGATFAADAADGVLLGLAAFSGFVLAYGRVAGYAGWRVTLAAGWSTAVLLAVPVGWWAGGVGFGGSVIVAAVSLGLAHVAMPGSARRAPRVVGPRGEIPLRMAVTAALVALLAAAAHA